MNKIDFQKRLTPYGVLSLENIYKSFPDFSYKQISRWQKDGFLIKIKQGFYTFADQKIDDYFLFLIANKIYEPSYISLEKALKYYGLIPEEIFQITSVSTKKTNIFNNSIGSFSYRHIKESLFWGYHFISNSNQKVLIADAEKAILDYIYLHFELKTENDFKELRINSNSFNENINLDKLNKYLSKFKNKKLNKRLEVFLKTIQND
jgi:predicted transcriptional regulator of viral defense system